MWGPWSSPGYPYSRPCPWHYQSPNLEARPWSPRTTYFGACRHCILPHGFLWGIGLSFCPLYLHSESEGISPQIPHCYNGNWTFRSRAKAETKTLSKSTPSIHSPPKVWMSQRCPHCLSPLQSRGSLWDKLTEEEGKQVYSTDGSATITHDEACRR